MMTITAVLATLLVAGGLSLRYAIARNGPAVVDTVDRLTGSERRVALVEQARFGFRLAIQATRLDAQAHRPGPTLTGHGFDPGAALAAMIVKLNAAAPIVGVGFG